MIGTFPVSPEREIQDVKTPWSAPKYLFGSIAGAFRVEPPWDEVDAGLRASKAQMELNRVVFRWDIL